MVNNFWDWSFPYFTSKLANFFGGGFKTCWDPFNLGQPSSYYSGYYLDFLLSRLSYLRFLKTEFILGMIILFLLVVIVLIGKKLVEKRERYLFVLLFVFNPAIYYKMLAGHLNYYFSYLIYIYLIFFLLRKYKPNLVSSVCLGLILAFVGFQIQFYIIAAITLGIFFLVNRKKFSVKHLLCSYLIVLLVNLPWLSNFLVGANKISSVSGHASSESFSGSMFASPLRVITMAFASATNIQYVYSQIWLMFFGLVTTVIFLVSLYYLIVIRRKPEIVDQADDKRIIFLICSWIIFSCLATGYFQKIPLPLISFFYPMFREVGHLAPIAVLFEVLTFAFIFPYLELKKYFRLIVFVLIGIFLSVNVYCLLNYLPKIDYQKARDDFQPFENFIDADKSSYRVLTYPFWNQYGFTDQPSVYKNGKLISNSGWDSFIGYSGEEYLSNYAFGGASIADTMQTNLLKNYDIAPLEQRNVKYIYDFSKFYESNFEKYTSAENYNSDLGLIKNDPHFGDKLILANPGKVTKVGDGILELNNTAARISGENVSFKKINETEYKVQIRSLKDQTDLTFRNSFDKNWKIYLDQKGSFDCSDGQKENGAIECLAPIKNLSGDELTNFSRQSFADETHSVAFEYANHWTLDRDKIESSGKDYYKKNEDGSVDVNLTLYYRPESNFVVFVGVSLLTILASSIYLIYSFKKGK